MGEHDPKFFIIQNLKQSSVSLPLNFENVKSEAAFSSRNDEINPLYSEDIE
jgi:hypothetical protein